MRVLYINHTNHRSGAGISLATLLRALPPEVDKRFMLPPGGEIADLLGAHEGIIHREKRIAQFMTTLYTPQLPAHLRLWHGIKAISAFPLVDSLVRWWRPDVVHINETTLLAYAYAARRAGLPVVLHARTAMAADRRLEMKLLSRLGGVRGFRFACIDEEVRNSLPYPCRDVARVIYNPVELGTPPGRAEIKAQREAWGFPSDALVIGQVASLHEQKGIWLILRLAKQLSERHPQLRWVLVGDDSAEAGEGPLLREAIRKAGLERVVVLPGYSTRLGLVYGALDVALCLFGGALGGVGRAAYEAAAAAKPLVATLPDPAASRTLRHGITGLLHKPDDEEGIQESLEQLINDAALRTALGRTAHDEIASRHAPQRIAGQMMDLYRTVIAESRKRA